MHNGFFELLLGPADLGSFLVFLHDVQVENTLLVKGMIFKEGQEGLLVVKKRAGFPVNPLRSVSP